MPAVLSASKKNHERCPGAELGAN